MRGKYILLMLSLCIIAFISSRMYYMSKREAINVPPISMMKVPGLTLKNLRGENISTRDSVLKRIPILLYFFNLNSEKAKSFAATVTKDLSLLPTRVKLYMIAFDGREDEFKQFVKTYSLEENSNITICYDYAGIREQFFKWQRTLPFLMIYNDSNYLSKVMMENIDLKQSSPFLHHYQKGNKL